MTFPSKANFHGQIHIYNDDSIDGKRLQPDETGGEFSKKRTAKI